MAKQKTRFKWFTVPEWEKEEIWLREQHKQGWKLIKVSVLKNCIDDPREIAAVIGERTRSEVIKVIGKKMIFFRQAKKNTKYNLPD